MKSLFKLNGIFRTRAKIKYAFLFIGQLIESILDMFSIALLIPFIQLLLGEGTLLKNRKVMLLFSIFNAETDSEKIYVFGIILGSIFLLKMLYLIILNKFRVYLVNKEGAFLSQNVIKHYMKLPYAQQIQQNSALLLRILTLDINRVTDAVNMLLQIWGAIITCGLLGICMIVVSPVITLVLLAVLTAVLLLYVTYNGKRLKRYNKRLIILQEKILQIVNQCLGATKEIKIMKSERFFLEKYEEIQKEYIFNAQRSQILTVIPKICLEPICIIILICIIFLNIMLGTSLGDIALQMSTIALVAVKLLPIMTTLNTSINTYITYLPSIEAVYDNTLLDNMDVVDKIKCEEMNINWDEDIVIDNISYIYPNTSKIILNDVSLILKNKKSIGIMGESGAGKSTLVDLVLGILTPISGKITCGKIEIKDSPKEWAASVGYIPQSIYILDESIRENIAFGVDKKDIDDTKVWEVLKKAQLDIFVNSLPDKLDTQVGERGARLSGGQRQRIGIARALYREPKLLVLDEATSALDNETEKAVMDAIEITKGEITMIIIAHRLSTIKKCDYIYEVKKSKIIERMDLLENIKY